MLTIFGRLAVMSLLIGTMFSVSGCVLAAGAALGAGGYEYHQAKEMDELDEDLAAGRIDRDEYLSRKKQIEETSVFQ